MCKYSYFYLICANFETKKQASEVFEFQMPCFRITTVFGVNLVGELAHQVLAHIINKLNYTYYHRKRQLFEAKNVNLASASSSTARNPHVNAAVYLVLGAKRTRELNR